jgi:hypothetical protein
VSDRSRYYKVGVREALFMLSRGRCYAPKCPQRVLRMVDEEPSINIQIAHINGLNRGSARFDASIPVRELNSFGNLLLLYQAHHGPVDDRSKEAKYPKKLLLAWKLDREGEGYEQLARLDVLGADDLEQILTSVVADAKDELLTAIDEVATISKSTAALLRKLVEENFDRPYLDIDAVAMLADSAASLRHLPDSAALLSVAARRLSDLTDSAAMLDRAASTLTNAMDHAGMIRSAASDLASAFNLSIDSSTAYDIQHATTGIETASRELSRVVVEINDAARSASEAEYGGPIIQQVDDGRHWQFFKWGLGTGAAAVAVLAILITIIVIQNKGG